MLSVKAYAIVAALMFGIGVYGALARRHAIAVLIAIELMLNAVTLNLVAFARLHPPEAAASGQAFVIFVMAVAAAEAIVSLALVLALFRAVKRAHLDKFQLRKW